MNDLTPLVNQTRGIQSGDAIQMLAQQLSFLKGYDNAHSRELVQSMFELDEEDMVAYLTRLTAGAPKGAAFMTLAKQKRAEYKRAQISAQKALHPERILGLDELEDNEVVHTKQRGEARLNALAKEYGSGSFAKKKKQQSREQSQRERDQQLRDQRQKEEERLRSRRICLCMATEHPLLRNCLKCGKIICEAEGEGQCLFCIKLSEKQQQKGEQFQEQQNNTSSSSNPHTSSSSSSSSSSIELSSSEKGLQKAIERKNAILAQQRNNRHTQVIDDQMDFFQADDRWMSPQERAALRKEQARRAQAEEDAKSRITLNIDFGASDASGCVQALTREEMLLQAEQAHFALADVSCRAGGEGDATSSSARVIDPSRIFQNPFLSVDAPVWIAPQAAKQHQSKQKSTAPLPKVSSTSLKRIQDDDPLL